MTLSVMSRDADWSCSLSRVQSALSIRCGSLHVINDQHGFPYATRFHLQTKILRQYGQHGRSHFTLRKFDCEIEPSVHSGKVPNRPIGLTSQADDDHQVVHRGTYSDRFAIDGLHATRGRKRWLRRTLRRRRMKGWPELPVCSSTDQ